MLDTERDKEIERDRFDRRARDFLQGDSAKRFKLDGAQSVTPELRRPYVVYEEHIRRLVRPGMHVLDVCCGTGLYSLIAAHAGSRVTAVDIAEHNLLVAQERAKRAGLSIEVAVADAEKLPFVNQSFEMVTCANSLSYVDLEKFLGEITRVLRPGGAFICVDSFNHSPIYRLNRYIHYLRGNRSLSTLKRMPNRRTLAVLRTRFPDLTVSYFGIGSFLMPGMRAIVGVHQAARFNDWLDAQLPFARDWAFKIVAYGHMPDGAAPRPAD
jgi:2-polyprenyl-3-methyl-5-hydroxy-6-metoxy-1,4-benzoquinol methylase